MATLRAQYGADFGNQIYEYSSPYYSVEKYIMAYCEEIHPVPPEDSWIVPLDVIEKYLLHMLIQANLEEGDIRDGVELVNHFQQEKISVPELLIDIIERIASYSLKDLMRVKLRWSIVQEDISFLEMCRASENLEALYRKGVFDFFNRNDPTALGMINQAVDGCHIGASYVLAIISIFNGGESMREGLTFIANMKETEPLKVRRCRHNLRNKVECGCQNLICWEEDPFVALFINLSKSDTGMVGPWEATMKMIFVKVILLSIPMFIWSCSVVRRCTSFLEMCKASGNLEVLYRKGMYDFSNRSYSNGLKILSQAADGGHIGASYVLAIISIFNGSESMKEGLMFIANMTPLKLRRCQEKLRYTLFGRVPEPHLLEKDQFVALFKAPTFVVHYVGVI
ncbi:hypothetical protein H5410_002694 [Solanum commersonii]|uniref:At2g35280-like TPR domain-containing protein n=1 Tax=Solanum commersonii TaxID=4109 RepID=A0A9J6B2P7_SOLCO|nr:hypothetical protein H5410_002694 [Solanum commersonii]